MPRDDSKLEFSSAWDNIDQIISEDTFSQALSASSDTIVTKAHGRTNKPFVEAQVKLSTSDKWYNPNNFQNPRLAVWTGSTNIRFYLNNISGSGVTFDVRYWVFTDGS